MPRTFFRYAWPGPPPGPQLPVELGHDDPEAIYRRYQAARDPSYKIRPSDAAEADERPMAEPYIKHLAQLDRVMDIFGATMFEFNGRDSSS
ncbi:hypothetical protein E4U61_002660 [Claviceps capensis]|nr:hypothetical protein E4U61_002660 [Claviceps capensis]